MGPPCFQGGISDVTVPDGATEQVRLELLNIFNGTGGGISSISGDNIACFELLPLEPQSLSKFWQRCHRSPRQQRCSASCFTFSSFPPADMTDLDAWQAWSPCDVTCGGLGSRERVRSCSQEPCKLGARSEVEECGTEWPCPGKSPACLASSFSSSTWGGLAQCGPRLEGREK